jgi:hypothetical protein
MRSYRPEELFDGTGQLIPALADTSVMASRDLGPIGEATSARLGLSAG